MNRSIWLATALLALSTSSGARSLGPLEFSSCTLASESGAAPINAQCAQVQVPEDRAATDGRRIALAIGWVSPSTGDAEPDPVFLLAGGPGQSARDSYPGVASAFSDVLKRRNVILLDQRGTGGSHLLQCAHAEDMEEGDDSPETLQRLTRACAETLSEHADLRHYTTTDAVADLDAVREAIGAETINLVGVSYGTRVAQQYAKAHPDRVRSIVLDGVVPNTLVLGQEHAHNLDDALARQYARCTQIPACVEAMGNPLANFRDVAASLRQSPRPVRYRDPVSGAVKDGTLTFAMLSGLVRMYAYQPAVAATLPLLLHELVRNQNDAAMAQARLLMDSMGDSMAYGMSLSVSCSEDADELTDEDVSDDSVLGADFVKMMRSQCAVWPRGQRPADFREPLRADVPVLLLSGELDPVTPPRYGDAVAQALPRARHLVLRGQGHNVFGTGCMPKLMARFIDIPDPAALDADCLDRLDDTPPFSGSYGWEP